MTLYRDTQGQGPDVVLLHGWGLNAEVWAEVADELAVAYRCTRLDLPGHGRSQANERLGSLDEAAGAVLDAAPAGATWVGWSLGGLVALAAALRADPPPARIVLVASSACFVRRPGWPHAMEPSVLEAFAASLEQDYRAALNRFLALQFRGVSEPQAGLRRLRASLLAHPPQPAALRDGLAILRDADLRDRLGVLPCPLRVILGERDTLVPASVGPDLAERARDGGYRVLPGAGHAPFVSRPEAFLECLRVSLYDGC